MTLDLKKLFPNSKFPTAEELKAKEDTFSIGDRVKVADNIRCRQHGQIGTIVRIGPEDKYNWKSFIVKFDDEKYNPMGFNSGSIDKILENEASMKKINEASKYSQGTATMKKIDENTKVTLTLGQLKNLVRESRLVKEFDQAEDIEKMRSLCLDGIGSIKDGISYWNDSDETEEIMNMLNELKVKILDYFDSIPQDNGI